MRKYEKADGEAEIVADYFTVIYHRQRQQPWYQAGVEWAVRKGVSYGNAPGNDITREQFDRQRLRTLCAQWAIGPLDEKTQFAFFQLH